ncbi:hypothetical protein ACN9MD_14955 [Stenotrophomonas maltophilia]|uniref:hypothetical protein n=1 Tax=Stenotrophomonas TaxID=40323 RepID=UPI00062DB0DE|nr:hypothetical protein [Stenotrophomonas maltophilia]TIE18525.1 hypothetical protein DI034_07530 [Stenotrophomonas maltophilia]TIE58904.1 hypothetical protein DI041_12610 [Stenotrophomonas maltophilia]HEL7749032.1 hypothetical protein [Stenotrophomonas maltophilia]
MPERYIRLFWLLVAMTWLALIAALVNAGFTPDYWLLRHLEGGTLPYPTSTVIVFALLSTVELVVAALIVQPWKLGRLWLRLLIAFVLLLAWSVPWLLSAMHQPPVQGMHLLWLLLLDVGLLLALCVVSLVSVLGRISGRKKTPTAVP